MAAARISKCTVDWTHLHSLCPKHQIKQLKEVKRLIHELEAKVVSLPAELPPIDWAAYSKLIPEVAEKYKKDYAKLTVPYPKDINNEMSTLESRKMEMKKLVAMLPPRDEWVPEIIAAYFPIVNDTFLGEYQKPYMKDYILRTKVPMMHWDLN